MLGYRRLHPRRQSHRCVHLKSNKITINLPNVIWKQSPPQKPVRHWRGHKRPPTRNRVRLVWWDEMWSRQEASWGCWATALFGWIDQFLPVPVSLLPFQLCNVRFVGSGTHFVVWNVGVPHGPYKQQPDSTRHNKFTLLSGISVLDSTSIRCSTSKCYNGHANLYQGPKCIFICISFYRL